MRKASNSDFKLAFKLFGREGQNVETLNEDYIIIYIHIWNDLCNGTIKVDHNSQQIP